ncbi:MAG: hypothetical protein ACE5OZ_18315 [Candidatus Heimdallarchaeota archaeon]
MKRSYEKHFRLFSAFATGFLISFLILTASEMLAPPEHIGIWEAEPLVVLIFSGLLLGWYFALVLTKEYVTNTLFAVGLVVVLPFYLFITKKPIISGTFPAIFFFAIAFFIPIFATFGEVIPENSNFDLLVKKYYLTTSWLFWSLQIGYNVLNPLLTYIKTENYQFESLVGALIIVIGYIGITYSVKKFAEQPIAQHDEKQDTVMKSIYSETAKYFIQYTPKAIVFFSYLILGLVVLGGFFLFLRQTEDYLIFLILSLLLSLLYVLAALYLESKQEHEE